MLGPALSSTADFALDLAYRTARIGREVRPLLGMSSARVAAGWSVRVPAAGGQVLAAVAATGGLVPFTVSIEVPGRPALPVRAAHAGAYWQELRIDLSEYAGRSVTIAFDSEPEAGQVVFWSEPMLVPLASRPRAPDVFLIVLDTCRLDHLTAYRPEKSTTPVLANLSRESLRFDAAISPSSWTLPAHGSLFGGRYPVEHQAGFWGHGFAPEERALAEIFRDAGYRAFGVSGGPFTDSQWGFQQGFDQYIDSRGLKNAADATSRAVTWLARVGDVPVFVFLNYFDAHHPVDPPADLREAWQVPDWLDLPLLDSLARGQVAWTPEIRTAVNAAYDAELAEIDRNLGGLFEAIRVRGRWDDSVVIVTSDHGELLGEYGHLGHGYTLEEELIRIPLVVKGSRARRLRAGVYREQIQLTDVFALTQTLAGLGSAEGERVWRAISGRKPVRALAFAEEHQAFVPGVTLTNRWRSQDLWTVRADAAKIVLDDRGRVDVYAVTLDAIAERLLPAAAAPRGLQARLERYRDNQPGTPLLPLVPSGDQIDPRLRALGYLK